MLSATMLWRAAKGKRPQAQLLSPQEDGVSLEDLYGFVVEAYGSEGRLYISGYEQEVARCVPVDNESVFTGAKLFFQGEFNELLQHHCTGDYFEARKRLDRKYPGTEAKPYYFWAVSPGLHAMSRPQAARS